MTKYELLQAFAISVRGNSATIKESPEAQPTAR